MSKLKPTIGIEVHVELLTKAKAFSGAINAYGDKPNTNITPICLAMPGTLPTLNKEIIELGLRASLVLNCQISKVMHFDRKSYFYPDNPKGYQLTQDATPIGYDGYVELDNGVKIKLERVHLEEDTAKSIHEGDKTLLNFNRAGVPLIEIVSAPVIKSSADAMNYLEKLRETLFYAGISDMKMEEGSMRCDVNISLSDNDSLGTKVEIKNIGSIKMAGRAIDLEIARQTKLLAAGETIVSETLRYDDAKKDNVKMRSKAVDDAFINFPEPDIPSLTITDEWIREVKDNMPLLPNEIRKKLSDHGINENNIKALINDRDLLGVILDNDFRDPRIAANLLISEIKAYKNIHSKDFAELISLDDFSLIVNHLQAGEINNNQVKTILNQVIEQNGNCESLIAELVNNTKELDIDMIITEVIKNNQESVNDFKAGKDRAIKHLMGQVMKETKGAINPKDAKDKLLMRLEKL